MRVRTMGIFDLFKGKSSNDNEILAPASGRIVDISKVPDPLFSTQMLGSSVAMIFDDIEVEICAPCSGVLTTLFPTGHAFGITLKNGVEILVHIGVNTVQAKGEGFTVLGKAQGDKVKAGEPIVRVDFEKLKNKYDPSTMIIITNDNGKEISWHDIEKIEGVKAIGIIK